MKEELIALAVIVAGLHMQRCSDLETDSGIWRDLTPISLDRSIEIIHDNSQALTAIIESQNSRFLSYCPDRIESSASSGKNKFIYNYAVKNVTVGEFENWFHSCDPRIGEHLKNVLEAMSAVWGSEKSIGTYPEFIELVREYTRIYAIVDRLPEQNKKSLLASDYWSQNIDGREDNYTLRKWLSKIAALRCRLEEI